MLTIALIKKCIGPKIIILRERRVGQGLSSALQKLAAIKNYYNEAGRPRYVCSEQKNRENTWKNNIYNVNYVWPPAHYYPKTHKYPKLTYLQIGTFYFWLP